MKRLFALAVIVMAAGMALAGSWAGTYSLEDGTVAVTNGQENSVWMPVAVLFGFDSETNSVMSVERVIESNTFVLGSASVSNVTSSIWVAEAEYPFEFGDVLRITSSATNGYIEIIRSAE
jgi:hypothetical protein